MSNYSDAKHLLLETIAPPQTTSNDEVLFSVVCTTENYNAIYQLASEDLITEVTYGENTLTHHTDYTKEKLLGQPLKLTLEADNIRGIYKNINDFLLVQTNIDSPSSQFYLIDERLCNEDTHAPSIASYYTIHNFKKLLLELSDLPANLTNDLSFAYFNGLPSTEFPLHFTVGDLSNHPDLQIFLENGFSEVHNKEQQLIFKKVVTKFALQESTQNKRFSHILSKFSELYKEYQDEYHTFIYNFSIDKLKEDFEENKLALTEKLSSSLGALQQTVIPLPIAIAFVASKINIETPHALQNILILLSFYLFALFFFFSASNHKRTLRFVITEIDRQISVLNTKAPALKNTLGNSFKELKKRASWQQRFRKLIGCALWISLISCTVLVLFTPQLTKLHKKIFATPPPFEQLKTAPIPHQVPLVLSNVPVKKSPQTTKEKYSPSTYHK